MAKQLGITKHMIFNKLTANFTKLAELLKGTCLVNVWFEPLNYFNVFSIKEPSYGSNNTSCVKGYKNSRGEVKITNITVYRKEPIVNHKYIKGGSDTFSNVLMVAQHEMLHLYLRHFITEVEFEKNFPIYFSEGRSKKSKFLISYLQHIQLNRVHRILDVNVLKYFEKLPEGLSDKISLTWLSQDKWEDMFHYIWNIVPQYWDTLDGELDENGEFHVTEISDEDFDDVDGVDASVGEPKDVVEPTATKSIDSVIQEAPLLHKKLIKKIISAQLRQLKRAAINGNSSYWDYSVDYEDAQLGFIKEHHTTPSGTFLLDVSGSMDSTGDSGYERIWIAYEIIKQFKGNFRVILFNNYVVDDMPRIDMERIKSFSPYGGTSFSCIEQYLNNSTICITDADSYDISVLQKCKRVIVLNNPDANLSGNNITFIEV